MMDGAIQQYISTPATELKIRKNEGEVMFNKFPGCSDIRRLNHVLGLVRAPVPIALDIAEYIDDAL